MVRIGQRGDLCPVDGCRDVATDTTQLDPVPSGSGPDRAGEARLQPNTLANSVETEDLKGAIRRIHKQAVADAVGIPATIHTDVAIARRAGQTPINRDRSIH